MIQIVVVLDVIEVDSFKEYEHQAFAVMHKYHGQLMQAFKTVEEDSSLYREVHILSFPDIKQFDQYQLDPALSILSDLRKRAIAVTQIYISEVFQEY